MGLAGRRDDGRPRRGVDDRPAALGQHLDDLVLHAQKHRGQVYGDHLIPLVQGELVEQPGGMGDTRVVEGVVELAERRHHRCHQGSHLFFVGYVRGEELALAPFSLDPGHRLGPSLGIAVGHRHLRPPPGEQNCGFLADPAGTPGYQCDLAFHRAAHGLLPSIADATRT